MVKHRNSMLLALARSPDTFLGGYYPALKLGLARTLLGSARTTVWSCTEEHCTVQNRSELDYVLQHCMVLQCSYPPVAARGDPAGIRCFLGVRHKSWSQDHVALGICNLNVVCFLVVDFQLHRLELVSKSLEPSLELFQWQGSTPRCEDQAGDGNDSQNEVPAGGNIQVIQRRNHFTLQGMGSLG